MIKSFIRLFTILILLSSCENSSDNKRVTIDNFDEKFVDSLIPIPDKIYSVFYAKIEGYSDDTIRLNISPIKSENPESYYYFIGDFEEEVRLDYYGESKKYIFFDPYKATKGWVKLKYQL